MADKNNRKQLYDYVSSRGDFRIGDYDSYEKILSAQFADQDMFLNTFKKNKRDYQENNHAYFYMTLRVITRPVSPAFPQVLL